MTIHFNEKHSMIVENKLQKSRNELFKWDKVNTAFAIV